MEAPLRRPRRRRPRGIVPARRRLAAVVVYVVSIVVVLGIWQVSSAAFGLSSLFPAPAETFSQAWGLLKDGSLASSSAVTMARLLVGWLVGSALGIIIGLGAGLSQTVRHLLDPYVHFLRFIPTLAWYGPALLWFGASETSVLVLVVYGTMFVVAINTMAGVEMVAANKMRMARSFGAVRRDIFFKVAVPGAIPQIMIGMRVAMGSAFMSVIAAEMLASDKGLGFALTKAQLFFSVPSIFAVVIALGALGFVSDRCFLVIMRRAAGRFLFDTGRE